VHPGPNSLQMGASKERRAKLTLLQTHPILSMTAEPWGAIAEGKVRRAGGIEGRAESGEKGPSHFFLPQVLTGIVRLFRQGEDKERAQGQSSTCQLQQV